MEISNEIRTGWPSQVLSTIIRSVSGRVRRRRFKIGITTNPGRRAAQYDHDAPPYYDEMIVIYESSTILHVVELESALIEFYGDRCDNERGGGGGRPPVGPPYYLYIVR